MPIITRAQQYRKFWQDLYHLTSAGIPMWQAMNIISKNLTESTDKFNQSIIKMAKEVNSSRHKLHSVMIKSQKFSEVECNIIKGIEIYHIFEPGDAWQKTLTQIMNGRLATVANQYVYFYETLGVLIENGVPILTSIDIISRFLDGPLALAVKLIRKSVEKGGSIAEGMSTSEAFTVYEYSLINAAEERLEPVAGLLTLSHECTSL